MLNPSHGHRGDQQTPGAPARCGVGVAQPLGQRAQAAIRLRAPNDCTFADLR